MLWEGGDAIGAYGTPLALMLLPYWTHGRIQSMEGLYFEASTTTPYHFMTVATLAQAPSNPVRGLPYRSIADFDLGVRYLQAHGRALLRRVQRRGEGEGRRRTPRSRTVATVPDLDGKPPIGWTIYGSPTRRRSRRCAYEPVVVDDLHAGAVVEVRGRARARRRHRAPRPSSARGSARAVPWFNDPDALDRPLADDGPASWTRADAAERAPGDEARRCRRSTVSNIRTTESSVEFDVSRTGVPVMVKTSYYPNWEVEGADGPVAGDAQLHGGRADRAST